MPNIPQRTAKYQGFKEVDPNSTPFEKAFNGTYNEMKLRKNDVDIQEMALPEASVTKFPLLGYLSKGNSKYDFKPIIKTMVQSLYHKVSKNAKNKPATVFGAKFPGDDEYLYDYDIWSNIHFGYVAKSAKFSEKSAEIFSWIHDILKGHSWSDINDPNINKDLAAVQVGFKVYDECGQNLTKECFEKVLFANKNLLNRHLRSDLIEKKPTIYTGDTLFSLSRENDIPVEEIMKKNPSLDPLKPLEEGQEIRMPRPDEVTMMTQKQLSKVMSSSVYLSQADTAHQKAVEIVTTHFQEISEFKKQSEKMKEVLDQRTDTPTRTPYFIWICMQDDKVRGSHATRHGKVYSWKDGPIPGQGYNCRCSALPYDLKNR